MHGLSTDCGGTSAMKKQAARAQDVAAYREAAGEIAANPADVEEAGALAAVLARMIEGEPNAIPVSVRAYLSRMYREHIERLREAAGDADADACESFFLAQCVLAHLVEFRNGRRFTALELYHASALSTFGWATFNDRQWAARSLPTETAVGLTSRQSLLSILSTQPRRSLCVRAIGTDSSKARHDQPGRASKEVQAALEEGRSTAEADALNSLMRASKRGAHRSMCSRPCCARARR